MSEINSLYERLAVCTTTAWRQAHRPSRRLKNNRRIKLWKLICRVVYSSLRCVCFCFRVDELEAKMIWLKNFERVQEIQQQIQWQPVT